ncbi:MAG: hypothetical protein KA752_11980, partial [Giesbergeria sp.]|nr:hypothetical protein [Giesbergeria sp.]
FEFAHAPACLSDVGQSPATLFSPWSGFIYGFGPSKSANFFCFRPGNAEEKPQTSQGQSNSFH